MPHTTVLEPTRERASGPYWSVADIKAAFAKDPELERIELGDTGESCERDVYPDHSVIRANKILIGVDPAQTYAGTPYGGGNNHYRNGGSKMRFELKIESGEISVSSNDGGELTLNVQTGESKADAKGVDDWMGLTRVARDIVKGNKRVSAYTEVVNGQEVEPEHDVWVAGDFSVKATSQEAAVKKISAEILKAGDMTAFTVLAEIHKETRGGGESNIPAFTAKWLEDETE